ncbi:MAG: uridine kinase, partial [Christensenellales bacterium]
IELRVLGLKPLLISLDDYYLSRDEMTPRADGTYDLEALEALDVRLFNEQLVSLLQGQSVHLSRFDFTKKRRSLSDTATQLMPGQPIIIEGIHGLNDALTPDITNGAKFRVYISALTQLNLDDHNRIRTTDARLIRRMVRDYQFRASPVDRTFDMWPDVVRGEEKNIFRFQEHADVMFNSSLMYELAILKGYAVPLLSAVSPDSPHYTKARRLLDFLSYFVEAHVEDEVPVNSILREFIGGCCFYRDKD